MTDHLIAAQAGFGDAAKPIVEPTEPGYRGPLIVYHPEQLSEKNAACILAWP